MNRNEWRFQYTASALANVAKQKLEHHASRLEWWESQLANVKHKIQSEGIEVHESVATAYSNTGQCPSIVIDATLQKDLNECSGKIREHRHRMEEYAGWHNTLAAQNPPTVYELDYDDYQYFFG